MRALIQYPYQTALQMWAAALAPQPRHGFAERIPAIAVFVSNCRGHRAEAIDWLQKRFDVHSYGACRPGGNTTGVKTQRRQRVEGGHFPECLQYRAVLAIENNACEDYVSEKLLEAVRCGAVPIVRTFIAFGFTLYEPCVTSPSPTITTFSSFRTAMIVVSRAGVAVKKERFAVVCAVDWTARVLPNPRASCDNILFCFVSFLSFAIRFAVILEFCISLRT